MPETDANEISSWARRPETLSSITSTYPAVGVFLIAPVTVPLFRGGTSRLESIQVPSVFPVAVAAGEGFDSSPHAVTNV